MKTYTFKVRASAGSKVYNITIKTPQYSEATDAQRKRMFAEGEDGVTIKVQGTLRRRIEKGINTEEALSAEAQTAWDAILNGQRMVTVPVIDAKGMYYSPEQVAAIESQGVKMVNLGKAPETEGLEGIEQEPEQGEQA